VCLTCTIEEEHGGRKCVGLYAVEFWNIDHKIPVGYIHGWHDQDGRLWWVPMLGEDGWTPVPVTPQVASLCTVRGRVTVPLYQSFANAEQALREAYSAGVRA
jgi:hypothetical protein